MSFQDLLPSRNDLSAVSLQVRMIGSDASRDRVQAGDSALNVIFDSLFQVEVTVEALLDAYDAVQGHRYWSDWMIRPAGLQDIARLIAIHLVAEFRVDERALVETRVTLQNGMRVPGSIVSRLKLFCDLEDRVRGRLQEIALSGTPLGSLAGVFVLDLIHLDESLVPIALKKWCSDPSNTSHLDSGRRRHTDHADKQRVGLTLGKPIQYASAVGHSREAGVPSTTPTGASSPPLGRGRGRPRSSGEKVERELRRRLEVGELTRAELLTWRKKEVCQRLDDLAGETVCWQAVKAVLADAAISDHSRQMTISDRRRLN